MRVSGGSGVIDVGYAANNERVEKQAAMASRGNLDAGPSVTRMADMSQTSESTAGQSAVGATGANIGKSIMEFAKTVVSALGRGLEMAADLLNTVVDAVGSVLGMVVGLLKKVT